MGMTKYLTILVLALSSVMGLHAQTDDVNARKAPPRAAYVPQASFGATQTGTATFDQGLRLGSEDVYRATVESSKSFTKATKWEAFEREYGIRQAPDSAVKAQIATAKYKLDKAVFAVDDFVADLEDALEFEYDFGRGRIRSSGSPSQRDHERQYFSPIDDLFHNLRLRSDVDLDPGAARAYIGMRLELPLGD